MNAPSHVWVVESSEYDGNVVCRVFLGEEEAQAYAATAREWRARALGLGRLGHRIGLTAEEREAEYRNGPDFEIDHRPDLVIEELASMEAWPDMFCDFFNVHKYPVGMPEITEKS